MKIPFNKPYLTGKEAHYMYKAAMSGKLSGNGQFTKMCQKFMEDKYQFGKCLLTSSCTDALEMAAILINIKSGDEVIMPSYTFVSTANAFILRGAKIVFADSRSDHPGIDEKGIESLITSKTKAIVPVHYAGVACDMDLIMDIATRYNLYVVEDAAQAIDSYYTNKEGQKQALGSIGHLSTFSFHETKNIISGEGGMLVVNDEKLFNRAEIIWEKGTNRSAFFRGEVDKYGWIDIGSSFLTSEVVAAFLFAQLESLEEIQQKRKILWNTYFTELNEPGNRKYYSLPSLPEYTTNNAHMFYMIFKNIELRSQVINALKQKGILAVFHYLSLHQSKFYANKHDGRNLPYTEKYTDRLLRLPMFFELSSEKVIEICTIIKTEMLKCIE